MILAAAVHYVSMLRRPLRAEESYVDARGEAHELRAPAIIPNISDEYELFNTSLDFYSRFGDVAIPPAAAVYVQRRWNYKIINKTVKTQQKKLQRLSSRGYERLPSMSSANFEAEHVSGVNHCVGLRRDASLS
ncbi:hypothetical protein ABZP36_015202 [Zizania latifolia]